MVAHVTIVVSELSIGFLKEYYAIIQQKSAFYVVFAFICIAFKGIKYKIIVSYICFSR